MSETIAAVAKELAAAMHTNGAASNQDDVDGDALLSDITTYLKLFIKMPLPASDTLAAFALHTHLAPRLDVVAYAHFYSGDKGCGKTVAMDVTYPLCANSLRAGDASVAFIARALAKPRTVFIDELDALFNGDKERAQLMRGMLNQGYKRSGTYGRCEPPKFEPVEYPIYGPKLFAGIGRDSLPDTLRHRSIPFYLERLAPDDEVEAAFERSVKPVARVLHERSIAWIQANGDAIVVRIDELYKQRRAESILARLDSRAFEIWAPLVAVCDLAGGQWPMRIRDAAKVLMLGEDAEDRSHRERLLANIYDVFEGADVADETAGQHIEHISSADLVLRLNGNAEWEWADWNKRDKDRGIRPRQIATLLKAFQIRIRPKTLREGDGTFKGYRRDSFEKVWKQYRIPSSPGGDPSQPSQTDNHAASSSNLDRSHEDDVTDRKVASNPDELRNVTDVTDRKRGIGEDSAVEDSLVNNNDVDLGDDL